MPLTTNKFVEMTLTLVEWDVRLRLAGLLGKAPCHSMVRPKAFTDRFQLGGQSISLRIAILPFLRGLRLPTSSSPSLI